MNANGVSLVDFATALKSQIATVMTCRIFDAENVWYAEIRL